MVGHDSQIEKELISSGWEFPTEMWKLLSPYEKRHIQIEMTGERNYSFYINRISSINFNKRGVVLDAACGTGQWSLAFSDFHDHVYGVDISTGRLATARELASKMKKNNCTFSYSELENIPYADNFFDYIFCYGVLMLCDVPKVLSEFSRVLKPNGRVYLNANTYGWYLHSLLDRGIKKRNLIEIFHSSRMILRTYTGKVSKIMIRKHWLDKEILSSGLRIEASDLEGCIKLNDNIPNIPRVYKERYYGFPGILEYVLEKK